MSKPQRDRSKYRQLPYGAGTVRQRGDRFEARWTENGVRRGKLFGDEHAARDFLYKMWDAKQRGVYREPSVLTVSELVGAWLERNRDTWSPNTYQLNRHILRAHVAPYVGDLKAIELDPARVQHMVDRMRADGKSANLIRSSVRVISSSYRSAIKLRIVSDNPATGVTLPRNATPVRSPADMRAGARRFPHMRTMHRRRDSAIAQQLTHELTRIHTDSHVPSGSSAIASASAPSTTASAPSTSRRSRPVRSSDSIKASITRPQSIGAGHRPAWRCRPRDRATR